MKVYTNRTFNVDIMNKIVEYTIDDIRHNRADSVEDALNSNIDSSLFYDDDMWDIMKEYQRPSEADWDSAFQAAWEDMYSAIEVEDGLFDEDEEEN